MSFLWYNDKERFVVTESEAFDNYRIVRFVSAKALTQLTEGVIKMEVFIKFFQQNPIIPPNMEGLGVMIECLLILNALDVLSGLIKAFDTKNVSSKVMKHGALTKMIVWIVILVSAIISVYLKIDLTSYVVGYYIVMEVVSILENASQFIPIPDKLKNVFNNTNKEETK